MESGFLNTDPASTRVLPLYNNIPPTAIHTNVLLSLHMPSSFIEPTCSYRHPASSVDVNCLAKLKHHRPAISRSYSTLTYRGKLANFHESDRTTKMINDRIASAKLDSPTLYKLISYCWFGFLLFSFPRYQVQVLTVCPF